MNDEIRLVWKRRVPGWRKLACNVRWKPPHLPYRWYVSLPFVFVVAAYPSDSGDKS